MFQGKRILAIIPARGGSKRVPRKNIKSLGGQPLIAFTIRAAQQCPLVDRIIVSTDDEEIADVARQFGADVPFLRPAEYASDTATDQSVAIHALQTLQEAGDAYDIVLWLRPTTPFKNASDMESALQHFLLDDTDLVRSVTLTEGDAHPYWMYQAQDDCLIPMMDVRPEDYPRSQSLPKMFYRLNGVVDAFRTEHALSAPYLFSSPRMRFIVTPAMRSVDIDEPHDFFYAEALLQSPYVQE